MVRLVTGIVDNANLLFLTGRSYASKAEEDMRLKVYVNNSVFIENHNLEASSGKHTYFLKMNQFGDMVYDNLSSITSTVH